MRGLESLNKSVREEKFSTHRDTTPAAPRISGMELLNPLRIINKVINFFLCHS